MKWRDVWVSLGQNFNSAALNKEHFNTRGSRTGAATSAKQAGMFDIHMKMLGRWRSDVYLGYG